MAYDPRKLYTMAYGGGFTLWHYASAEPLATVARAGYFDAAARLLHAGDRLMVTCRLRHSLTARDFLVSDGPDGRPRLLPLGPATSVACRPAAAAAAGG